MSANFPDGYPTRLQPISWCVETKTGDLIARASEVLQQIHRL